MSQSSQITPFTFPATGQPVRTVLADGEPCLISADVCAVLGLGRHQDSTRYLDEDEKRVCLVDTPGGQQQVSVVNEPGLYSLILRSRRPEAKAFKRWVTHDVLPAIRKTGSYSVAELGRKQLAQMVIAAEEERERLAVKVAELEPEAARARQTMDAHGMSLVGTVAKRFGIQERKLWDFLRSEKLIIRGTARRNEPYAEYIQSGHFAVKVRVIEPDPDRAPQEVSTIYVSPKGEALIWHRLYRAGFVTNPRPPARQLEMLTV